MSNLLRRLALVGFHLCVARPILHWAVGVRYRRRGLVPEGPCLVVSNHNSHLDAAVLMGLFRLRRLPHVHPVAAADYFGKNLLRQTMAMMLMNAIPIERRVVRGQNPLSPIRAAIERGESLIFFPEGSRGEAGVVGPFRQGIGVLVRELPGLLVVPVFLSGPERVWPRGELVPVPLGIDVHVGKPRSYSADREAREIAEAVRADVLALAPPPPPVPGRRPAPPVNVAVCGIDPHARRAVHRAVTARLGRQGPTLGVGDPALEADATGVREIERPVPWRRGRGVMRLVARLSRRDDPRRGDMLVEMLERARIVQTLERGSGTRFVVEDGSALVELMAQAAANGWGEAFEPARLAHYLGGHNRIPLRLWWAFLRRAPEVWAINVLDLARPTVPRVLVVVTSSVSDVLRRLRSTGMPLGPHETPELLERLQAAHAEVGRTLARHRKVELIEVGADPGEIDAAARRVEDACLALGASPSNPAVTRTGS